MPFKKTHQPGSHPSGPLFIGRDKEVRFFVQQILKPEEPIHNILSIWGQGGVGKTTLLHQFKRQATLAECRIAWVDEQQSTPASIMEKCAQQLHLGNTFAKALHRYREAVQLVPPSASTPAFQHPIVRKAPDLTGSLVEGIPFVGPPLREITKVAAEQALEHLQGQREHTAIPSIHPLNSLTRVFVTELNHLAEGKSVWLSGQPKQGRKVVLFFDTFEQVAEEVVPWLLHGLLEQEIYPTIVLVIVGRNQLERSTAASPKYWLPYYDDHTLHALQLQPFTHEETVAYLAERGITMEERIEIIWHLSHGLPLYLGLLAAHMQEGLDPTKDVVDNFLQRIPDFEPTKRQLALDAALFSRPFNLDDLGAFPYLPEQERSGFYDWLLRQPFIQPSSLIGHYNYHDLTQKLFQRYVFQHSPDTYYATRRTLATYYQRQLEHLQTTREKNRYGPSEEKLEIMLALATQRFFLPDQESHFQALLPLLDILEYEDSEQMSTLRRWLQNMIQRLSFSSADSHAHQVTQAFLRFIETVPEEYDQKDKQAWFSATDQLFKLIEHTSSRELLAYIHDYCGWGYSRLKERQQALTSFEQALKFHPHSARIYNGLGFTYFGLKEYQQAVDAFNHGLELAPFHPHLYLGRGRAYGRLKAYQQALNDFDHSLRIDWRNFPVYINRARLYMIMKEYQKALADWDHIQEVAPGFPRPGLVPFRQGCAYLWLKNLPQATISFTRSHELAPTQPLVLWAREWSAMCQTYPGLTTFHYLEAIAKGDRYIAYVCRGVIFFLRKEFRQALLAFQQATTLPYDEYWHKHIDIDDDDYWEAWDTHFWGGMVYLALDREEEARRSIEQALALQMPPILLKPLSWFQQESPKLYEKFVKPLLDAHNIDS